MGTELTKSHEKTLEVIGKHGFNELIKPLIREIHLFDSHVAGTFHLKDKSVLDTVKTGDELTLLREENPHDRNAILVLNAEKKKIGYVPRKDNLIFARLMNAGKLLKAKVTKVEPRKGYMMIGMGIYLVDL